MNDVDLASLVGAAHHVPDEVVDGRCGESVRVLGRGPAVERVVRVRLGVAARIRRALQVPVEVVRECRDRRLKRAGCAIGIRLGDRHDVVEAVVRIRRHTAIRPDVVERRRHPSDGVVGLTGRVPERVDPLHRAVELVVDELAHVPELIGDLRSIAHGVVAVGHDRMHVRAGSRAARHRPGDLDEPVLTVVLVRRRPSELVGGAPGIADGVIRRRRRVSECVGCRRAAIEDVVAVRRGEAARVRHRHEVPEGVVRVRRHGPYRARAARSEDGRIGDAHQTVEGVVRVVGGIAQARR